jgi:hypothetical protein
MDGLTGCTTAIASAMPSEKARDFHSEDSRGRTFCPIN